MITKIVLIIICVVELLQTSEYLHERVILKIYYSALDPTCLDFFRHELNDLISSQLVYYIHIEMHPFAGCDYNEETKYIYCKLGQGETISNMHHLCAMHQINTLLPKAPETSYNIDAIRYIVCTLKEDEAIEDRLINVESCSKYTKDIDEEIDDCEESNRDVFISNLNHINSVNLTEIPMIVIAESEEGLFERRQKILEEMCKLLGPYRSHECLNRTGYNDNDMVRSRGNRLKMIKNYFWLFLLMSL
ncbi:uncharacterized protein [Onthophagus taurus]|uniref:uncharacterized protein n=1 Tax=Onthophagus taurus TaxID=166361 RepID=UPI0039BE0193